MRMVKEADIDRIAIPEGYDVPDASARAAVRVEAGHRARLPLSAQLRADDFRRLPRPNRKPAMGPVWFERTVEEWEKRRKDG